MVQQLGRNDACGVSVTMALRMHTSGASDMILARSANVGLGASMYRILRIHHHVRVALCQR